MNARPPAPSSGASRRPSGRGRLVPSAIPLAVVLGGVGLSACGPDPGMRRAEAAPTVPGGPDGSAVPEPFTGGLPLDDATVSLRTAEVMVNVADNLYEPRVIKVSAGTKVTFNNTGANPHNVVPSGEATFTPIPTGKLDPKSSASITFADPGVFAFHCSIHGTANKGQRGVVVVE